MKSPFRVLITILNKKTNVKSFYGFQINIVNNPPTFTTALFDQPDLKVGIIGSYNLPEISDVEGHDCDATIISPSPLPDYVHYDTAFNKFTFSPTLATQRGTLTITLSVFEIGNPAFSTTDSFSINIVSDPPFYLNNSFTSYDSFTMRLNHSRPVTIPAFKDPNDIDVWVEVA
jgi:hypothetical protein